MSITPASGISSRVELDFFTPDEIKIVEYLSSRDWFVTATKRILLPGSTYKGLLLKPSEAIRNAFNLNREIAVAFSPYNVFEPRAFDALDSFRVQELRLEEICSIIISADNDVDLHVSNILKSNAESRVIIAFSYAELLLNQRDPDFLLNRFREKFYSRDLFGIQDPLKKDLYFFGRRDLIQTLVNRHLNGENSGVFGLRKTGKTSILFSIERTLDRKKSVSLYIDCQTLHLKSWNTALFSIVDELRIKVGLKSNSVRSLIDYTNEEFVADHFFNDLNAIFRGIGKKSILLIFDEIENITFGTSASENWRSGENFIKFWQVVRSTFQRIRGENVFSYLIAGTNPRCIEKATIDSVDNPIFAQFPAVYIPPFDFSQTKEMIEKLGGYMGMGFEGVVCAKLLEDYGGHPLLMRQMCSFLHNAITANRPFNVSRLFYEKESVRFSEDEQGFMKYASMVLEVLANWYPDELEMLTLLAIGDHTTFDELATGSPEYVSHLLHYGILEKSDSDFGFKIDALKGYLAGRHRYKKLNLTQDEKKAEISARRNTIEPQLRKLVRRQLRVVFGEATAKEKVIIELHGRKELSQKSAIPYSDFFDPYKTKIYFSALCELIRLNWDDCFKNVFGGNVEIFKAKTTLINAFRKPDAHAAEISDSDFQSFRGAMSWLEEMLQDY